MLELLFLNNKKQRSISNTSSILKSSLMDTVSISDEARELANTSKSSGSTVNTSIDASIDLQNYVDEVSEKNQEVIESPGDSIKSNNGYTSITRAYQAALNDKYTQLVAIAKQHSNPSEYIYQKYYDSSCSWYESDLSDKERQIGYNYENDLLNTGKMRGVKMEDSLFRNLDESTISNSESMGKGEGKRRK